MLLLTVECRDIALRKPCKWNDFCCYHSWPDIYWWRSQWFWYLFIHLL